MDEISEDLDSSSKMIKSKKSPSRGASSGFFRLGSHSNHSTLIGKESDNHHAQSKNSSSLSPAVAAAATTRRNSDTILLGSHHFLKIPFTSKLKTYYDQSNYLIGFFLFAEKI